MMFGEPSRYIDEVTSVTRTGGESSRIGAPQPNFRSISLDYDNTTIDQSNPKTNVFSGGMKSSSPSLLGGLREWHPVSKYNCNNADVKSSISSATTSATTASTTTTPCSTSDYQMEMIMNDINSSLNLDTVSSVGGDDVDDHEPLRGRQDSSCSRGSNGGNIWTSTSGSLTNNNSFVGLSSVVNDSGTMRTRAQSSSSSSPTWGVIGEAPVSTADRSFDSCPILSSSRLGSASKQNGNRNSSGAVGHLPSYSSSSGHFMTNKQGNSALGMGGTNGGGSTVPSLETVSSCSTGSGGSSAFHPVGNNQKLLSPPGFRSGVTGGNMSGHWQLQDSVTLESGIPLQHPMNNTFLQQQQQQHRLGGGRFSPSVVASDHLCQASLDVEYRQPLSRSGHSRLHSANGLSTFVHQPQAYHVTASELNMHSHESLQHGEHLHHHEQPRFVNRHQYHQGFQDSLVDPMMNVQGQRRVFVQQDYQGNQQYFVSASAVDDVGMPLTSSSSSVNLFDHAGSITHSANGYVSPHGGGMGLGHRSMMHQTQATLSADRNTARAVPSPTHTIPSQHGPGTMSIQNLTGQIRRLSRDQMGCRLLQQALMEDGPQAATAIFQELLPYMAELMMDPFGNYLFQKLLNSISSKELELLVRSVSPRLVQASLNLHGTRSVQKVIDVCSTSGVLQDVDATPQQVSSKNRVAAMVAQALKPAASRLCIDSHGNHVMQRILSGFPPENTHFIYECVANNVTDVARHRHGCCVIQRCLDSHPHLHYISDEELAASDNCVKSTVALRKNLMDQICSGALHLMQDAYGNYVVQYVLDVCVGQPGEFEIIDAICKTTIGRVSQLSIQKFSSNVIEKCLEKCSDNMRAAYLAEISSAESMKSLMNDPFGNYVVQRALCVSTHDQAVTLVEAMRPHLVALKNTAPGRRIIGKIIRRFPHFNLDKPGCEHNFDEVVAFDPASAMVMHHREKF